MRHFVFGRWNTAGFERYCSVTFFKAIVYRLYRGYDTFQSLQLTTGGFGGVLES